MDRKEEKIWHIHRFKSLSPNQEDQCSTNAQIQEVKLKSNYFFCGFLHYGMCILTPPFQKSFDSFKMETVLKELLWVT